MFRKAKILIVEDEKIIAKDIADTLQKLGHTIVGIVSRGEEAIKFVSENKTELVLMDITLKGEMDGIETAGIINGSYNIPVVYITAHQDSDTIEKSKSTNPYGYITKPIDDKDLNSSINSAIYRYDSEQKLKKAEEKYFRLTENAADLILSYSPDNKTYNYVNKASLEITGYKPGEFYSHPGLLNRLVHPDWKQYYEDMQKKLLTEEIHHPIEFKIIHKSGIEKWLNQRSVNINSIKGRDVIIESIITDVTQRKLYENKIEESNLKLRALASHLQTIKEEERTNIAREIHDQLGQDLTVLKMDISIMLKELSNEEKSAGLRNISSEFVTMMDTIDRLIKTVRKIATELRPDVLDKLGITEAIRWYAEEFEKRTTIQCLLDAEEADLSSEKEKEISLYRTFQETLTNIARHSGADKISIILKNQKSGLLLMIEDNGRGITQEELEKTSSLGILGMNERVLLMGGSFEIEGKQGKGTKVTIKVPLQILN